MTCSYFFFVGTTIQMWNQLTDFFLLCFSPYKCGYFIILLVILMNTSTIPMIKGTTFGFSHLLSEKATLPFTSLFYSSGVPKATHAPQRSVSFKPFHPPLLSCSHVFNKRWTHFSVWSLDYFQFTIYYSQTLLVSKLPLICDFSCAQTVYVYWRQLFTRDYWW